jgi:hypothetical protein
LADSILAFLFSFAHFLQLICCVLDHAQRICDCLLPYLVFLFAPLSYIRP